MRENLSAKNTREGVMKINRKVHKKEKANGRHPTRVYISGIGTPTEGIAGLVEELKEDGGLSEEARGSGKAEGRGLHVCNGCSGIISGQSQPGG